MVYANVEAVNNSITSLRTHALEINSSLLSLQDAAMNFTAACGADVNCEREIPAIPFLYGLDGVSKINLL
jgi:hypothetical protein